MPQGNIFCQANVFLWCLAYGVVSGSLLVVNKWALHYFPVFLLLAFQMATSAIVMYTTLRLRGETITFNTDILKKFSPVVFLFFLTLVTSSYSLQYLTVDILVALRCCSTFFVAAGEFFIGDRKLPSLISTISLLSLAISTIFVFAVGAKDYFTPSSLFMGISYVFALSTDQVINRMFVVKVDLSTDERVLWMNALCFVGVTTCFILSSIYHSFIGEGTVGFLIEGEFFSLQTLVPLITSCLLGIFCSSIVFMLSIILDALFINILGLGMSYTSWSLRTLLSALLFTVVGCVCKLLSLIINAMFLAHLDGVSMTLVFLGVVSTLFFEETEQKKKEYLVDLEKGTGSDRKEDDESLIFNRQRMAKLSGIVFLFFVICFTSIIQVRKTDVEEFTSPVSQNAPTLGVVTN